MMQLNCEYVRDVYPDYLNDALDAETAQQVRAHILTCDACASEAAILDALQLQASLVPADLHARVLAAAALPQPRKRLPRAALVMAASIAIAVIGGIAVMQSADQPPAAAREPAAFGYVSVEQAMLSGKASLDDFSEEQLEMLLKEMET